MHPQRYLDSTRFENTNEMKSQKEVDKLDTRLLLTKVLRVAQSHLESKLRMKEFPQIIGVGIEQHKIKLMLDKVIDAPEGFTSVMNGTVWEIEISNIISMSNAKLGNYIFPFFGLLGYYQGTSCFYLNFEICESLRLRGEHPEIVDYLHGLCQEMIGTEEFKFRLFSVGYGYELAACSQFMAVDRLSDILPVIEKQAENFNYFTPTREVLQNGRLPILVIDPFTDNQELLSRLEVLAGRGVTSMTGYGNGKFTLEITKCDLKLSPLGLELKRNPESSSKSESVFQSLKLPENDKAKNMENSMGGNRKNGIVKKSPNLKSTKSKAVKQPMKPRKPPTIQMLGAVKIQNASEKFKSYHSMSLICYLAANRNGVTADQMMRWVWPPDEPPTRQTLANIVSKARRALGVKASGEAYIYYESGIYHLDSAIKSDYEEFRMYLKKAASTYEVSEKIDFLHRALSLVKGVPFSMGHPKAFMWADNSFRAELEYEIDTAAHRLCDLIILQSNPSSKINASLNGSTTSKNGALSQGDYEIARFALNKGAICIPGCDQCLARMLILAAKAKNCGALIKTKSQMVRAYESLGYAVPMSLLDLFARLYRGIKDGNPELISAEKNLV